MQPVWRGWSPVATLRGMRPAWFGVSRAFAAESAVELALLAAIAENRFDEGARDRLARALVERPELNAIDWDWALERAEALEQEAPLFTEARQRVTSGLGRPDDASAAVALAAGVLGHEPSDEARFLLTDVAERLGVVWPRSAPALPGYARCTANDPEASAVRSFADALAHADEEDRRLLLFKLQAARSTVRHLSREGRVLELGHQVPTGPYLLFFDALLQAEGKTYHCRFLASGEALHAGEHTALPRAVDHLALGHHLLLAHQGPMAPQDASLWAHLDPRAAPRLEL